MPTDSDARRNHRARRKQITRSHAIINGIGLCDRPVGHQSAFNAPVVHDNPRLRILT